MRYSAPAIPLSRLRTEIGSRRIAMALLPWFLPAFAFAAIIVRRWTQYGTYVPGFDEGSWLAIGRGYFGDRGRSTDVGYAPLVPMLLQLFRFVVGALTASKIVGTGSLLAIIIATYILARQGLSWWLAACAAATVGLAGLLTEGVAHGGYPQGFAFAFLLLAALGVSRFLAEGAQRHIIGAGLALVGAALSHHMYFPVSCLVVGLIWLIWLSTRPAMALVKQRTVRVAGAGVVAVLCYLPTYLSMRAAGYDPPIDASGWTMRVAFRFSISDAVRFWSAIFIAGALFVALTYRRRREPLWQVAAALMVSSAALFLATKELRLIPPLIVGSTLGVGLALQSVWSRTRDTAWGGIPLAIAAALPMLLWPLSDAKAANLNRYYQVLDKPLMQAADFVQQHQDSEFVVVRQNRKGWPVGWWFEGLTTAKIAVGSPERWLAFPRERDNARLANQFFIGQRTGAQVADLAARSKVRFLVFEKEDWLGWQAWVTEPDPRVKIAYDDGEYMIVDVAPG